MAQIFPHSVGDVTEFWHRQADGRVAHDMDVFVLHRFVSHVIDFAPAFVAAHQVGINRDGAGALTLSMIGFAILKGTDLKDGGEWVFPSFWQGSLFGGALFGFGMVIAGGCGAGSLWRAGEGHIKLWIAVLFFALGASAMRQWPVRTDLIRRLGSAVFLPDEIGWVGAAWSVLILMALWYLLSGWNEQRKGAGLLKL